MTRAKRPYWQPQWSHGDKKAESHRRTLPEERKRVRVAWVTATRFGVGDLRSAETHLMEIGLPGWRGMFNSRFPPWKRFLWFIVILASTAACAYQVYWRVDHYLQMPITTSVYQRGLTKKSEIHFPSITLCPYNPFASSRFVGWQRQLVGSDSTEALFSLLDVAGVDVATVWNKSGDELPSFLKLCRFERGKDCSSANLWQRLWTVMGLCHTLTLPGMVLHLGTITSMRIELHPILDTSQWLHQYAWKVLIHDNSTDPTYEVMTRGSIIYGKTNTMLAFLHRVNHYKNTPSKPCSPAEKSSRCLANCYDVDALKNSTCRLPYMKNASLPLCRSAQQFRSIYDVPIIFKFRYASNDCVCERSCDEHIFEVFVDTMVSDKNVTSIRVHALRSETSVTREEFAYSLTGLFCDIGGAIGLYLGACIISVIEVVDAVVATWWAARGRRE